MKKYLLVTVLTGFLFTNNLNMVGAQDNSNTISDTLLTVGFKKFESAFTASRKEGKGIVIDVRTPEEFAKGHSPIALNIDFYSSDFLKTVEKLDKDDAYFIYCNSGNRSRRTLKLFEQLGFKEVYDLKGGWVFNRRNILSFGATLKE